MKRSDLLKAAPLGLLGACAGPDLLTRSLLPVQSQQPAVKQPCYGRLGDILIPPRWFLWHEGHDHTGEPLVNYNIWDTHGYNGVGPDCRLQDSKWTLTGSMQLRSDQFDTVHFSFVNEGGSWSTYFEGLDDPRWSKGKIIKLFEDGLYHIGDGGYPGGTLRKSNGDAIAAAYMTDQYGKARLTLVEPKLSGVTPFEVWKNGKNGDIAPDNAGGCFDLVTDFGLGLAAGLMGCLTTEAVVGVLGLAVAALQFAKAIKDVDECKER